MRNINKDYCFFGDLWTSTFLSPLFWDTLYISKNVVSASIKHSSIVGTYNKRIPLLW